VPVAFDDELPPIVLLIRCVSRLVFEHFERREKTFSSYQARPSLLPLTRLFPCRRSQPHAFIAFADHDEPVP